MFALDTEWHDWKEYSLGYAGWDSPPLEADLSPEEMATVSAAAVSSGSEVIFKSSPAIN